MKLFSDDFDDGGNIPAQFTCDGDGLRPSLSWSDIPKEAKSLVLSIVDPDAPSGKFVHYLLSEIPAGSSGLDSSDEIGHEIINTTGETRYVPPCPPSGQHQYIFTLYALNIEKLSKEEERNFFDGIRTHVLIESKIVGIYGRN